MADPNIEGTDITADPANGADFDTDASTADTDESSDAELGTDAEEEDDESLDEEDDSTMPEQDQGMQDR